MTLKFKLTLNEFFLFLELFFSVYYYINENYIWSAIASGLSLVFACYIPVTKENNNKTEKGVDENGN